MVDHQRDIGTIPPATAETHKSLLGLLPIDDAPICTESVPGGFEVTNLDFDVTENCNLGCLYCFKGEKFSENMPLGVMKRTFDWLCMASGTAKSINCNFMGGEPTMRWKQIREFAIWARRRGKSVGKQVRFSMTTNLTLWTPDIRRFVDEYGFGILMSIDGCPEVQDAQRPAKNGKPASATVEYWARSLLATRPRSTARATLHPNFVHTLSKSIKYLHSIGFSEIAVSPSEYAQWTEEDFTELEAQLTSVVGYLEQHLLEGKDVNITGFKYYIGKLIHPRAVGDEGKIQWHKSPCGAGKGYMMVDYTGDIWPCHRFDGADEAAGAGGAYRLGNIYGETFNHELRRSFLEFDHFQRHKDSCTTCPANPVCGGYCPAANLADTGSIFTPHDTYCRWTALLYSAAESLYWRVSRSGNEAAFKRLVESSANVDGTGEK